jgi:hypothetical protein
MNLVQSLNAGAGSNTAAISFGGYDGSSPGNVGTTQEFNAGINLGAWYTAAPLNTARKALGGSSSGTQTASIVFGGGDPTQVTNTESYNGTAWAEVNDLNTARRSIGGAGTQTSALGFGGWEPLTTGKTESWNGYTWTEVADLNTPGTAFGAGSSNTNALKVDQTTTESWNGTSWTEVADINTARKGSVIGTNTAALVFGGDTGSTIANTEQWNGSSWTELNDLNTARYLLAGSGISTLGLAAGGFSTQVPGVVASAESWNGTSWNNENSMNVARDTNTGSGTSTLGLISGGSPLGPNDGDAVEEWNGTGSLTRTITSTTE